MGIPLEMNTILVLVGGAGLLACGAVRLWHYAKDWIPKRKTDDLVEVTRAYSLLHDKLCANGSKEHADRLRCEILPQVLVKTK